MLGKPKRVNILVREVKGEKERGSCFGLYGTSPAQMLGLSFTGLFPAIPAMREKSSYKNWYQNVQKSM
jgi:hypothetical protein